MKRTYKWTYLYAAVAPTTGESFRMYLPGMDDGCLKIFLGELSKSHPEHHLLIVVDGAPSHRSEQITHPENISLLRLPPYSPELDIRRRGGLRSSGGSCQTGRSRASLCCKRVLPRRLDPYWEEPSLLKRLIGYSWWVKAVAEAL